MTRAADRGAGARAVGTASHGSPLLGDGPVELRETNADRQETTGSWKATAAIAAVLLAALALRLYRIGAECLWLDEAFTLRDTHWPPSGLNVYRPVYYVLLWLWMRVSDGDLWARALAVLFGVANVWATYRLGREVAGRRVGLVAALACAVSPLEINHSQEIRMYTAASFLGVLGSLAALRLNGRSGWWQWLSWLVCRALAILTSSFDALLLIGDALLLKARPRTRRLGAFVAGALTVGSLAFLTLSKSVAPLVAWTGSAPAITPVSLLRPFVSFAAWQRPPFHNGWPSPPGPLLGVMTVAFGAVVAVLLGLACFRRSMDDLRPLAGWALAPLALLAAASLALAPLSLWLERYLLFTGPYVLILAAASLMRLWRTHRVIASSIMAFYMVMVWPALASYYRGQAHTDWTGVAEVLREEVGTDDAVAISHGFISAPLEHYLQSGRPIASVDFPDDGLPDAAALRSRLGPLCSGGRRVFLVCWEFRPEERLAMGRALAQANLGVANWRPFAGLDLYVLANERP
ncbi:MAG: glycosyltransferase family 39 protein [Acidobacteriia bacterium]|nr:glycosyltransferase family 39 protein [Terriglobia bacterium]